MSCKTYTLPEVQFIGNTTQFFYFEVNDEYGSPIDLNGAIILWKMLQYGQFSKQAIIKKTLNDGIVMIGLNSFQVKITSNDTKDIYGKFIHQAIITDISGNTYIPAQGFITIDKAIS